MARRGRGRRGLIEWPRRLAVLGALSALSALSALTGCGQSSVSSPPNTATPDTSGPASTGTVANAVPSLGSGEASMTGTVMGPQGPAPGATIEIARTANGLASRAMITSDGGGAFAVRGVPGGGYSVRAWLPPDMAQTAPTTFFLAGQGSRTVTLDLTSFSTALVQAAVAPDPPVTGEPAQVVVQVTSRRVQSDGTVVNQPAEGLSVRLDGGGTWQIPAPNPASTDSSGQATWTATCEQDGSQHLDADLGAQTVPLGLSACLGPPPSTTTTSTTTTLPYGPPPTPYPTTPYPTAPFPTAPYPTAPYPTGGG